MTNLNLFILTIVVFFVLISSQKVSNISKTKRYQQVWLPIYAVIFMIVVLNIEDKFLHDLTAFVYSYFPILEDYSIIVLNLLFLMVFVLTKVVWKNVLIIQQFLKKKRSQVKVGVSHSLWQRLAILLPRKWVNEVLKKDKSVFIAYENTAQGIKLIPEWVFARTLFGFSSIGAFVIVLCFIGIVFFHFEPAIINLFPRYPILSFILLAELTWFLGGELLNAKSKKLSGEDVISVHSTHYDALFEEYKRLWPERILAASISEEKVEPLEFNYQTLSEDQNIQRRVNHLCERLKRNGLDINGNYAQLATDILEEKDVLVEDPNFQELAPYFFSAIYGLLAKNKKLLVITNDQNSAKEAVRWFQEGIEKVTGLDFVWSVSLFSDAFEQNMDADILVVSPNYLLNQSFYLFLEIYQDTGYTEGVIFLEADKTLAKYGLLLNVCQNRLEQNMKKRPQYLVFSQWQKDLEHSVREFLISVPKDRLGSIRKAEKLYYLIWKMEGKESFQSKILSKMVHRRLDSEVILALPAIKFGVEAIHFAVQNQTTTEECLAELIDQPIHLKKYGIKENQFAILERNMSVFYQDFCVPVGDFRIILIRDQHFNLIEALKQWYSVGRKKTFVHVVSPSYLLRDYFANNIDHFLEDSRKFSPLATRVANTVWRKAYLLLERLSTDFISEEDIRKEIHPYGYSEDTLVEALNNFFHNILHLDLDFMHQLRIKSEEIFDKNSQAFVKMTKYFLPPKVKQQLVPDLFRFLDIRTTTGEILGQMLAGYVSHHYLVGQYHAINGQLYQITKIDPLLGHVEVRFESPNGDITYRQSRQYQVSGTKNMKLSVNNTIPIHFDEYEIKKCILSQEVKVQTNGYFTFSDGINLMDSTTQFTAFTEEAKRDVQRQYPLGNVLLIKISASFKKFANSEKLAFTLAHLLNECIPTLFPSTYSYLAITTVLSDKFFPDTPFMERMALYMPQLTNIDFHNSEEEIYLYIIEDSPIHMGLVESISENLEHIFEIIADYLDWALEQMKEGYKPFFYLGESHLPDVFDIDGAFDLLNDLTPKNELKELRKTNMLVQVLKDEPVLETAICDFCGEPLPIAEKESLDDGRDRCYHCRITAVNSVNELEPLYDEVRDHFLFHLKLNIRQDIYVKLLSSRDIQDHPFIPTSEFDPRIIGKAIRSSDNQFTILIENGAPKSQTLGTLAHELTHIWQYEHLDLNQFTLEQLEGHAVWTEIFYLETIGELRYAKKLKESILAREDKYGRGYREILERLKEYPRGMTPFELFQRKLVPLRN
ncbi:hypothetical protein [Pseudoneobacillus sp. C159]